MLLKISLRLFSIFFLATACFAEDVKYDNPVPDKFVKYYELEKFSWKTLGAFLDTSYFLCDTTHVMAQIRYKSLSSNILNWKEAERYTAQIDSVTKELGLLSYQQYNKYLSVRRKIAQNNYYEARDDLLSCQEYFEKHKNFDYLCVYDTEYTSHYHLFIIYWLIHDRSGMHREIEWCIKYNKEKYKSSNNFLEYQLALYLYLYRDGLIDPKTPHNPVRDSLFLAYDQEMELQRSLLQDVEGDVLFNNKRSHDYHNRILLFRAYHYLRKGELDRAKNLYYTMEQSFTEERLRNELKMLLADLSRSLGHKDIAKEIYDGFAIGNNMTCSANILDEDIWSFVADMYAEDGDLDCYKYFRDLRDTILIGKQEVARKYAQKRQAIKEEDVSYSNYWIWTIVSSVLLLLVLIGIRYFPSIFMDRWAFLSIRSNIEKEERKRLSGELHDNIASRLTGIKLSLDRKFRRSNDLETQEILSHLDNTLIEVRNLSHELSDPDFENMELCRHIQNYIDLISGHDNIQIHADICSTMDAYRLNDLEKINIYRIFQEIMNNILKHSKATLIHVDLNIYGNTLNLIVEDNGIGFDTDEVLVFSRHRRGIGLQNCLERASAIRGTLQIESVIGDGSVFIFSKLLKPL